MRCYKDDEGEADYDDEIGDDIEDEYDDDYDDDDDYDEEIDCLSNSSQTATIEEQVRISSTCVVWLE